MNDRTTHGFLLSATLHALVAALLFLSFYLSEQAAKTVPKVLELVAGEGDNYMATEAPALGTPGGIKLAIPEPPAPAPAPPEPAPVQAAPTPERVVERAPTPPKRAATKPAPDTIRDFSKDVTRIAKKRAARLEAIDRKKREAEERKAKEAELKEKRMTKEEFDRQNRAEAAAAKNGARPPKISRIDAEGIARGVAGGSTANKIGGASGKALTREEGDAMDLYFSLLKSRLRESLEKPPGLSDSLIATVEVQLSASGAMSGARVKRSSGSDEFDHAALAAVRAFRSIGPRPDGKSETIVIPFRMREPDEN